MTENNHDNSNSNNEVESTRNFHEDLIHSEAPELTAEEQAAVDALPKGNALLIVRRGPSKGSRFLLDADLMTVGRHPNADIVLDDVTVSRRHAEIKRVDGKFTVIDQGSLNGTHYDGKLVESQLLSDEGELQIGKYHFTFYSSKRAN